MRRRTLDILLTTGGLVLAAILLVAGSLLVWANTFIEDQVTTQLTAQRTSSSRRRARPPPTRRSGRTSTSTPSSSWSTASRPRPTPTTSSRSTSTSRPVARPTPSCPRSPGRTRTTPRLPALVQTAFRGETLRGLLLNAYAFWKMAQIAMYAAIAAFVGAGADAAPEHRSASSTSAGSTRPRRPSPRHTEKAPALA